MELATGGLDQWTLERELDFKAIGDCRQLWNSVLNFISGEGKDGGEQFYPFAAYKVSGVIERMIVLEILK